MGGSRWSDDHYTDRAAHRAATSTPTFAYDHAVRTGKAKTEVHDSLNIKNKFREARDSEAHPESLPIAVFFDVTGSMHQVPMKLQKKLPGLMGLLLRKGYVQDPQILFGAIGDYMADKVPLQVGQFESGIEMDDNLTNIFLEQGGGGQKTESYQDAVFFMAHRVKTDAWEKRQKKGYLFIIGDEMPFNSSPQSELQALIADDIKEAYKTEVIFEAAKEKWEVFFILPKGTSYYDDKEVAERWKGLVGPERFIKLEEVDSVCETIGLAVGLCEGTALPDNMAADLKDVGASAAVVKSVTTGLGDLAKNALVRVGTGSLPEKKSRSTAIDRL